MELLINNLLQKVKFAWKSILTSKAIIPVTVLGYYIVDSSNLGFIQTNALEIGLMILLFMSVKANYHGFTFSNSISRKAK